MPIALAALALLLFTYFHPGRGDGEGLPVDGVPAEPPDATVGAGVVQLEDHRRVRDGTG